MESDTPPGILMSVPLTPVLFADDTERARVEPAKRRLRIIIASQYFPPEIGATQTRMQAFAEFLAARGHRVTVICEFPNHPHGVIPAEYRGRLLEDDRTNPYRILRVWVKANPEKTTASRLGFYLSYMALATAVAPLAGRADVVLATTPPLFVGAAGLAIARINLAPLVLDVRDLWPAAAVGLNEISTGRALHVAEALERRLYKSAGAVVAVTRPFCEHIDGIRRRPPRTVFIPNGTLEWFFARQDRKARAELGIDAERFLVTFAGTHGIAQGLSAVLQAATRANGIHFAFVGEGPSKNALVASARELSLENVSFHAQVPIEQIPRVLASSDALVVPLSAHPTFAGFVPSKLYDFMAVGRPVIFSGRGEAARIVEVTGSGLVVEPEQPGALAQAAVWLAEHPREASAMGKRGQEFARGRLRRVQAERLEQVILHLAAPPRARYALRAFRG
jgi:putative colanic acid biosynthesis glycosyltransferase WcaI